MPEADDWMDFAGMGELFMVEKKREEKKTERSPTPVDLFSFKCIEENPEDRTAPVSLFGAGKKKR